MSHKNKGNIRAESITYCNVRFWHLAEQYTVRFKRGADIVSGIYTLPASGVPWWNTNFHCPFAENSQYEERRVARLPFGLTVL